MFVESFNRFGNIGNAHDRVTFAYLLGILFTVGENSLSLVSFCCRLSELVPVTVLDDLQILVSNLIGRKLGDLHRLLTILLWQFWSRHLCLFFRNLLWVLLVFLGHIQYERRFLLVLFFCLSGWRIGAHRNIRRLLVACLRAPATRWKRYSFLGVQ